jgi:hypothetical protein
MARNTENDIPNVNLQNDHLPDFSQSGQLRTSNMIGARKELERATPQFFMNNATDKNEIELFRQNVSNLSDKTYENFQNVPNLSDKT